MQAKNACIHTFFKVTDLEIGGFCLGFFRFPLLVLFTPTLFVQFGSMH